ncbi:MAG: glycerol kinase GlpK [Deltaproteobacteria bacterium]|nr:glycerol kinase GlpK [Deltaproteobacteria bacterium]
MEKKYILSIDQGTTSSRAIIFDTNFNIVSIGQKEFNQIYPKPGWVEHNPDEIWESIRVSVLEALANGKIDSKEIAAIGITNQRETSFFWEKEGLKPVYNAIVWQCRRSSDICNRLIKQGLEDRIKKKTGLVVDPYFSSTKIIWLLKNIPEIRVLAEKGKIVFGTSDTFVLSRLTSGDIHATDVSNASRTMLFNIRDLSWDTEILKLFKIPAAILPKVMPSAGVFGYTKGLDFLPDGIPISGIAGDQQAALFGQCCFDEGEAKITYGTGAFLLTNTGDKIKASRYGLLTTIAWQIGDRVTYAIEGSVFIAGAVIQWLRDGLKIIKSSKDVEKLADSVPDSGGVVVVPAFVGLGAPHWKKEAKGLIWGITRGTSDAHIAKASIESIALQSNDIIEAMEKDMGKKIKNLKVDGGAAKNDYLLSFQATISNKKVIRPQITETTAMGAAMLSALGVGLVKDTKTLKKRFKVDKEFTPSLKSLPIKEIKYRWQEALRRV